MKTYKIIPRLSLVIGAVFAFCMSFYYVGKIDSNQACIKLLIVSAIALLLSIIFGKVKEVTVIETETEKEEE